MATMVLKWHIWKCHIQPSYKQRLFWCEPNTADLQIIFKFSTFGLEWVLFKCSCRKTHKYWEIQQSRNTPTTNLATSAQSLWSLYNSNTCTSHSCHKHMNNKLVKKLNWKYLKWHHKVYAIWRFFFKLNILISLGLKEI